MTTKSVSVVLLTCLRQAENQDVKEALYTLSIGDPYREFSVVDVAKIIAATEKAVERGQRFTGTIIDPTDAEALSTEGGQ